MKAKLLDASSGQRTFVVVLEAGERVMEQLQRFTEAQTVGAAQVTAIGALKSARIAFWRVEEQSYIEHNAAEQTEVLSLLGDVVLDEKGKPALHLHAVLGRQDMSTIGGHFLDGTVMPTLEVIVTESPAHLQRRLDRRLGLATITWPSEART